VDRAQKRELVSSMNQVFSSTAVCVVTHYSGLTVAKLTELRNRMREAGASFKVTKNRLSRLALKGTDMGAMEDLFTGPTAIGYSDDPVAAPKVLSKFAKENEKLIIVGGMMGSTTLDVEGVQQLALLPSLDELRAKLVGMINTPATRIAGILQAPGGQLARVFSAYGAKDAA
jgi:large subunit ribosomal protein L10